MSKGSIVVVMAIIHICIMAVILFAGIIENSKYSGTSQHSFYSQGDETQKIRLN